MSEKRQRQTKKIDAVISSRTKPSLEEELPKIPTPIVEEGASERTKVVPIRTQPDPLKEKKDLIEGMSEEWLADMRMKYTSRGGYHPNNWLKVIDIQKLKQERDKEINVPAPKPAAPDPKKRPKPTPEPVLEFRKPYPFDARSISTL